MKSLILFMVVGLASGAFPQASTPRSTARPTDAAVIVSASRRAGALGVRGTLRWLQHNAAVARATLGADGRTIDVLFRGGEHSFILPGTLVKVQQTSLGPLIRASRPPRAPGQARAAVWEPFATELGLGPNAGDSEVQSLRTAGFSIDSRYDTAVSIASLQTMADFNVLYMHTHSGVSASGAGVVASGEPVNGDPSVAPLLADGSVVTVGVSGSSQAYYGITSRFLSAHVGRFTLHSLLFLNGCSLLRSSSFWQTLSNQGVGAMVSWDQNAAAKDDFLSAAAFFNVMGTGATVSGALTTLRNAGYATSIDNGIPAILGYLGDGSITLAEASASATSAPTPTASTVPTSIPSPTRTSTVNPTPTAMRLPPTATIMPTPTRTSTPVPTHPPVPAIVTLLSQAKPGTTQDILLSRLVGGSTARAVVSYPNGVTEDYSATADSAGDASLLFKQRANAITRFNRVAVVQLTVMTASGIATTTAHYTVGFGAVDIATPVRVRATRGAITIFVHAKAHRHVTVLFSRVHAQKLTLHGDTGERGWLKLRYRVRPTLLPGTTISIRATVKLKTGTAHTSTVISLT